MKRASTQPQVWVLGAHGMLGLAVHHHFRQQGWPVVGLTRTDLDATGLTLNTPALHRDDVVINCIGLINRRLADHGEADFLKVNALFPRVMADACGRAGAHFIHVSTDCVFSACNAPHDESAVPDAADLYGRTKALGEPANALVIRSSIIGPELRHHYSLMCWLLSHEEGSRVQGFTNHWWNGMTTLQMARCLEKLLTLGLHREPGLLHLHSDNVTKFDLLSLLVARFDRRIDVEAVAAPEARDMRLASCRPEIQRRLGIPLLAQQVDELRAMSAADGRWLGAVS